VARGQSGRIVLEVDPELKQRLYASVVAKGLTLRQWFLGCAEQFLQSSEQPELSFDEPGLPDVLPDRQSFRHVQNKSKVLPKNTRRMKEK
jgi:hypothetical protein